MSIASKAILTEALRLTTEDRLDLANELLASLDGPADPEWDGSWLKELDRRSQTARDGASREWSAVRSHLLARAR
jgi:hypothetical protein